MKQFLKPQISKIIIFVALILIFGLPAISRSCSTFPLMRGETAPPCIEKFTFSNIIVDVLGLTRYPHVMDATTFFSYNPSVVVPYLVVLYLSLSLLFHISHYDWKKVLLYLTLIGMIIFVILIFISITKNRTY
jgi:hypothetical protein